MTNGGRGNKRAISICLIDFKTDPETLQKRFGRLTVDIRKEGSRRGRDQVFPHNFVAIWQATHALNPWDECVEQLVEQLGGWAGVKNLIAEFAPREVWLRIDAPILSSPYVESNSLSASTVREMAAVGMAFQLSVRDFVSDEPTHLPK